MRRFWSKVDRSGGPDACWLWTANRNRNGYGTLKVGSRRDATRRTMLAHRKAWELMRGQIPPGSCVLHRCDNPPCCNPAHLFLGTQADNLADMHAKGRGRGPVGRRNSRARFNEMSVRVIRFLRAKGTPVNALARAHKTGRCTIWCIATRRTWQHVP